MSLCTTGRREWSSDSWKSSKNTTKTPEPSRGTKRALGGWIRSGARRVEKDHEKSKEDLRIPILRYVVDAPCATQAPR